MIRRLTTWWSGQSAAYRVAIVVGPIATVLVLLGTLSSSETLNTGVPEGAVAGRWDKFCVEAGPFDDCQSNEAGAKIEAVEAWCQWRASEVHVHVRLRNEFGARVEVAVTPRYVIKDGGQHGTSFGSDEKVKIDPGQEADLDINAGRPEGVAGGATIEECAPRMEDADITN